MLQPFALYATEAKNIYTAHLLPHTVVIYGLFCEFECKSFYIFIIMSL